MAWKNESRRHSLARKGIKTANKLPSNIPRGGDQFGIMMADYTDVDGKPIKNAGEIQKRNLFLTDLKAEIEDKILYLAIDDYDAGKILNLYDETEHLIQKRMDEKATKNEVQANLTKIGGLLNAYADSLEDEDSIKDITKTFRGLKRQAGDL